MSAPTTLSGDLLQLVVDTRALITTAYADLHAANEAGQSPAALASVQHRHDDRDGA